MAIGTVEKTRTGLVPALVRPTGERTVSVAELALRNDGFESTAQAAEAAEAAEGQKAQALEAVAQGTGTAVAPEVSATELNQAKKILEELAAKPARDAAIKQSKQRFADLLPKPDNYIPAGLPQAKARVEEAIAETVQPTPVESTEPTSPALEATAQPTNPIVVETVQPQPQPTSVEATPTTEPSRSLEGVPETTDRTERIVTTELQEVVEPKPPTPMELAQAYLDGTLDGPKVGEVDKFARNQTCRYGKDNPNNLSNADHITLAIYDVFKQNEETGVGHASRPGGMSFAALKEALEERYGITCELTYVTSKEGDRLQALKFPGGQVFCDGAGDGQADLGDYDFNAAIADIKTRTGMTRESFREAFKKTSIEEDLANRPGAPKPAGPPAWLRELMKERLRQQNNRGNRPDAVAQDILNQRVFQENLKASARASSRAYFDAGLKQAVSLFQRAHELAGAPPKEGK